MSSDNYYFVDYVPSDKVWNVYHMFSSEEFSPFDKYERMGRKPLSFETYGELSDMLDDYDNYPTEYGAVFSEAARLRVKEIIKE